jgi:nucleotide-binding universal stress UspA family protein
MARPAELPSELIAEFESRESLVKQEIIEAGRRHDVVVDLNEVSGHPSRALVEASRTAGLLVVGSRGRGAFAGMLLGSVSGDVVRHAHCTVVVVR